MVALLTADDVLTKKFPATKFREGYDVVEVDDFLDEVLTTLRELYAENDDLKAKLEASERRVAELSRANAQQSSESRPVSVEKVPEEPKAAPVAEPAPVVAPALAPREPEMATGIIQMAQKLHDDHVRAGQEEGDRLIAEAKSEGNRIVREAEETSSRTLSQLEQERSLLERKIDELRIFERDYRTRLKSYLQNLLGDLDNRGSALPSGGQSGQDKQGI